MKSLPEVDLDAGLMSLYFGFDQTLSVNAGFFSPIYRIFFPENNRVESYRLSALKSWPEVDLYAGYVEKLNL